MIILIIIYNFLGEPTGISAQTATLVDTVMQATRLRARTTSFATLTGKVSNQIDVNDGLTLATQEARRIMQDRSHLAEAANRRVISQSGTALPSDSLCNLHSVQLYIVKVYLL